MELIISIVASLISGVLIIFLKVLLSRIDKLSEKIEELETRLETIKDAQQSRNEEIVSSLAVLINDMKHITDKLNWATDQILKKSLDEKK